MTMTYLIFNGDFGLDFLLTIFIYMYGSAKKPDKKSIEDEQTLAELSSAHRRSQAKCQLIQKRCINHA